MQSLTFRKILSAAWILPVSLLIGLVPLARLEAVAPRACPCTLSWDTSPDPTTAGYAIYYGIVGSVTTNRLDVGATNVVTLNNLLSSLNYFFYVSAYNHYGIESQPSGMMLYRPKILSPLQFAGGWREVM